MGNDEELTMSGSIAILLDDWRCVDDEESLEAWAPLIEQSLVSLTAIHISVGLAVVSGWRGIFARLNVDEPGHLVIRADHVRCIV
jgi:hypothetical protein